MKIEGIITWVGALESGVSAKTGNQWKNRDIEVTVTRTHDGKTFSEEYLLSLNGENADKYDLLNKKVIAEFYAHTNLYEGRKYLRLYCNSISQSL